MTRNDIVQEVLNDDRIEEIENAKIKLMMDLNYGDFTAVYAEQTLDIFAIEDISEHLLDDLCAYRGIDLNNMQDDETKKRLIQDTTTLTYNYLLTAIFLNFLFENINTELNNNFNDFPKITNSQPCEVYKRYIEIDSDTLFLLSKWKNSDSESIWVSIVVGNFVAHSQGNDLPDATCRVRVAATHPKKLTTSADTVKIPLNSLCKSKIIEKLKELDLIYE